MQMKYKKNNNKNMMATYLYLTFSIIQNQIRFENLWMSKYQIDKDENN